MVNGSNDTHSNSSHGKLSTAGVIAFNVLQLASAAGLTIVLLTAIFSKRVRRSSAWISFCVGWIIACLSYELLFFAGVQGVGRRPEFGLCVVQGALVHSVPVLQAGTNLSLLIHTWLFVRSTLSQKTAFLSRTLTNFLLLGCPYILSLSLFLGFLFFGFDNPSTVKMHKEKVYCDIFFNGIPSIVTVGTSGALMIVALVFKALLGYQLYRHWIVLSKDPICVSMIMRVKVFTLAVTIIFVLTFVYCFTYVSGVSGVIFMAIIPIVAVLILGTRRDILNVWMFWKAQPPLTTGPWRLDELAPS